MLATLLLSGSFITLCTVLITRTGNHLNDKQGVSPRQHLMEVVVACSAKSISYTPLQWLWPPSPRPLPHVRGFAAWSRSSRASSEFTPTPIRSGGLL